MSDMSDDKFLIHKCPECGAQGSLHDKNCSYGEDPLPSYESSSAGAIVVVICGLVLLTLVCVI